VDQDELGSPMWPPSLRARTRREIEAEEADNDTGPTTEAHTSRGPNVNRQSYALNLPRPLPGTARCVLRRPSNGRSRDDSRAFSDVDIGKVVLTPI
jgi:hypothetical protein